MNCFSFIFENKKVSYGPIMKPPPAAWIMNSGTGNGAIKFVFSCIILWQIFNYIPIAIIKKNSENSLVLMAKLSNKTIDNWNKLVWKDKCIHKYIIHIYIKHLFVCIFIINYIVVPLCIFCFFFLYRTLLFNVLINRLRINYKNIIYYLFDYLLYI